MCSVCVIEDIEIVAERGPVNAPTLVVARAAKAGCFQIHDAVTSLQRARFHRRTSLVLHSLQESVGPEEVDLARFFLACVVPVVWRIHVNIDVFLVQLNVWSSGDARACVGLIRIVTQSALQWAVWRSLARSCA